MTDAYVEPIEEVPEAYANEITTMTEDVKKVKDVKEEEVKKEIKEEVTTKPKKKAYTMTPARLESLKVAREKALTLRKQYRVANNRVERSSFSKK